jgi:hypothetical protein
MLNQNFQPLVFIITRKNGGISEVHSLGGSGSPGNTSREDNTLEKEARDIFNP